MAVKNDRKPSDVQPTARIDGGPIATLCRVDSYARVVESGICDGSRGFRCGGGRFAAWVPGFLRLRIEQNEMVDGGVVGLHVWDRPASAGRFFCRYCVSVPGGLEFCPSFRSPRKA